MIIRAATTLMAGAACIAAGETATTFGASELLAKLVEVLGPVGLAVWYCYYTTTCTLPRKDKDYQALEKTKDAQLQSLLDRRDELHRAAIVELTGERKESSVEIRKGLDSMAAAVSQLSVQFASTRVKGKT